MAQPSILRVSTWLEKHLGPHALLNVPVKLNNGANFSPNQSGLTNWRHDGRHLEVEVEMLQLCQAHIFEPTLAHEYGHVMLIADPYDLSFTGGIGQARLQEEEGFCEVLRYLWVSDNGAGDTSLELKAIKDNADTLYGDGFRLMWPRYKAAGSILNLRAEMLGISRGPSPKLTGWPFGKKKQPVVPPSVTPQVQPQSTPPQYPPIPDVVEGGSHRPMLDLGLDKTTQKTSPVTPSAQEENRPTIDFALQPKMPQPSSSSGSQPSDEQRPIIRFD
jgi:hypothetical protein